MNQAARAVEGEAAPDFTLKDSAGEDWRLSDRRGHVVVLLFYPSDGTPVCTRQMCSVRDHWSEYAATGAEVVAISTDSVESHRKFTARHHFPFRLLSDPGRRVARTYGAASWLPGRAARAHVVIDAEGFVRHLKVQSVSFFRPTDDEVLAAVRAAQAPRPASA